MKGSNLAIEEAKREITSLINKQLQEIPIGVVKLLLESSLMEVNSLYSKIVEKETSEYEEESKIEQIQNGTNNKED